jgi:hypothetical protein
VRRCTATAPLPGTGARWSCERNSAPADVTASAETISHPVVARQRCVAAAHLVPRPQDAIPAHAQGAQAHALPHAQVAVAALPAEDIAASQAQVLHAQDVQVQAAVFWVFMANLSSKS